MEAQMHRPIAGHQEQSQHIGPNSGEVGHDHHEKKSVLKKVKAKAKKIKETVKHLGLDDHEEEHEDNDQEYDDAEMVDDGPELHGAPIYESAAIRSGVLPNQDIGIMAPKPTSRREEDPLDSNVEIEDKKRQFVHRTGDGRETTDDIPAEHKSEVPHGFGIERTEREPGARFGVLEGLQEDPQVPMDKPNPSNYETKVTAPTAQSVEEIEVRPLVASFGKMTVEDETKPKSSPKENNLYSGSHDQFSPEPIPTSTQFGPESIPKHFDSGKPGDDMPRDPIDGKSPSGLGTGSTYTAKISSAATLLVDNATTAKNAIASKLGYGDGTDEKGTNASATPTTPTTEEKGTNTSTTPTKSPTTLLVDKATTAKNAIASKLGYGDGTEEKGTNAHCTEEKGTNASATTTTKSPTTLLVDKATTAKNAIASKLGYGDGTEEKGTNASATPTKSPTTEEKGTNTSLTPTKSPTEDVHKAAGAVTGTLAPIYSKVASVGNALVSKVPGISTEEKGATESATEAHKPKGATMKDYWAEKLKPGEEDKALSEVISDSLHVQKGGGESEGRKPIGQVTESEEVARQLGSGQENRREGTDALIAGSESSGNGIVEKIKDAATSWVTKGGESPTSHQGSAPMSLGNVESS